MSVFHLKYRPKKIADLDLSQVRDTLLKIFGQENIPQSFLFCGPKGAGKTSAARIVAKIVNCSNPKNGEACGKCPNCLSIDEGRAGLDIMEMDAASNRGIDDIRLLKEKIYLSPISLTSKVFVIDEVHMLTKEAFNALLKILEEPPKNVYFVLCTTNPEKIPETVMSRLVRVDFRRGTVDEMVNSLKKVVKGEELKIENSKKTLEQIATLSEGSFRNGQKILMELVMDKGSTISQNDWDDFCSKKYSAGAYDGLRMEMDLSKGNIKKVLEQLEALVENGVDMPMYRQRLIEFFQKRLVKIYSTKTKSVLDLKQLAYLLRLLIRAGKEEKEAVLAQLPLQLAVVDFGQEYGSGGESGETKEKEEVKQEEQGNSLKKNQKSLASKNIKVKNKKVKSVVKKVDKKVEESGVSTGSNYGFSLEDVRKSWKNLLVAVRPYNHSVEAFLRSAQPLRIEGNRLVVEVFYKFHKERLEDDRNRRVVEAGLQKVFSVPMLLECVLATKGIALPQVSDNKNEKELYDVAKEIFGD